MTNRNKRQRFSTRRESRAPQARRVAPVDAEPAEPEAIIDADELSIRRALRDFEDAEQPVEPLDFEHEYERHEPPGAEGGTPERTLTKPPNDGPSREDPMPRSPEDVGAFYLGRATATDSNDSRQEPIPSELETLSAGTQATLDQQPGQSLKHGSVVTAQPNRTEVEAERSELARSAVRKARRGRGDRGGARHRAIEWEHRGDDQAPKPDTD